MKVIVGEAAAADLEAAISWISKDSPGAAAKFREKIVARINNLAIPGLAHVGRRGRVSGTRELIVPPFIIVYETNIDIGETTVLAIFHAARDRDRPA